MRTPPRDLTEAEVGVSVAADWHVVAESIEYAPVGFGSHHWMLTEAAGRRWFLTADAVADSAERLAELSAALTTAYALRHRRGLEFVVAPQAGVDDELLSITGRYALALYPYLERVTDAFANPQQLLTMIIALHAATPDVGDLAAVDDLSVRDRSSLEAVLNNPDTLRRAGPYAAHFTKLIMDYREPIRAALDRHDAVASTLAAERGTWVITHGEPKANNTMITASGPVLVDWDTVQLAPPARDLWMMGSIDTYTSLTGREVPVDQLKFYRLRWDLKDLCGAARWFTGPHQQTADTELAWQGSIAICNRLATNSR